MSDADCQTLGGQRVCVSDLCGAETSGNRHIGRMDDVTSKELQAYLHVESTGMRLGARGFSRGESKCIRAIIEWPNYGPGYRLQWGGRRGCEFDRHQYGDRSLLQRHNQRCGSVRAITIDSR